LLSPLPYIVTSHYSNAYATAVATSVAGHKPDVVICEWTPYAIYARPLASVTKLVSAHNVEADIWKRYADIEKNLLRRWYIQEQYRKVKRFERAALQWVDGALTVSHLDCARLREDRADLPIETVENGVDLDYFRPLPQPDSLRHLVFTGSMDWRPNQDAARYFAVDVMPLLRRARPELECTFVGRNPPSDIAALGQTQGIHITGTVEDVRPYVERASVYIVPLRVGGGSRLKILEALAMGRAVVSTTVGAEGLHVEHGRHLLLADNPRTFADSVLRLLDDPALCSELGTEGRRLVEARYDWNALAERLARFIAERANPDDTSYQYDKQDALAI
jgi:glycosyltransferase involved in cell wall biosynthesis